MHKLVIATGNPGKLRELEGMLKPLNVELVTQAQLGIREAEEPHCTFVENALAKARNASRASGLPALADDSGLCVAALGGAPGVLSARYAGEPGSDQRNNEKLLQAMHGIADRRAYYYCVLVLVRFPSDPQPIIADGEWRGEIALQASGEGGFGYDPLFRVAQFDKTSAELSREVKKRVSHRAVALKNFLQRFRGEPV
jgi:XTP/dITP diphosphohydrolase